MTCNSPQGICYKPTGICVQGKCQYEFHDQKQCNDSTFCTEIDYCQSGVCVGNTRNCQTTQTQKCIDSVTLRIPSGAQCNEQTDSCEDEFIDYQCTYGCNSNTNTCEQNPCEGKICNSPPSPSECYSPNGLCDSNTGDCIYSFISDTTCNDNNSCTEADSCDLSTKICKGSNVICNSPSSNTCNDNYTKKVYSQTGSCSNGSCSYTSSLVSCDIDESCDNGNCVSICSKQPTIQVSQSTGISDYAKIAFDGVNFGVVWQDNRHGEYQIYFKIINQRGQAVTNELRITNHSFDASKPDIVWNDTNKNYVIVWQDKRHSINNDDNWELYFAKLNTVGQIIGSSVRLTNAVYRSERPSIVWNGTEYAIAWHDNRNSTSNREIYFMRVNNNGTIVQSDLRVTDALYDSGNVHLVWNGTQYLLSWFDDRNTTEKNGSEIYTKVVNSQGLLIGNDNRITDLDGTNSGSVGAFNATDKEYGLVWADKLSDPTNYTLLYARADQTGTKIGTEKYLTTTGNVYHWPNIHWIESANKYLLLWSQSTSTSIRNLHYAYIDKTGMFTQGPTEIISSNSVQSIDSAVTDNISSVVYTSYISSIRKDIILFFICL